MPSSPRIVWLHGAFGAGKSSVAAELQRRSDGVEILSGLRAHRVEVLQVLLDATDDELRQRILSDTTLPADNGVAERTTKWRLAKLDEYGVARPWLRDEADVVVDTGAVSVPHVTTSVLDAMPELRRSGQAGRAARYAHKDG
jgi:chloramphenicol 3-O-phosphotransferase